MTRDDLFTSTFPAIVFIGGIILALWSGACEIVHRWEARAPEREHAEPCQDTTELAGSTITTKLCHKDAFGTLERAGDKVFWVCRCARDGGP